MASMFKQPGATGLREVAETKNAPASFPSDVPYDYEKGLPKSMAGGTYKEGTDPRPPTSFAGPPKAQKSPDVYEPKPFANLRGRK